MTGTERQSLTDRVGAQEALANGRLTVAREPVEGRNSGEIVLPVVVPIREPRTPFRSGLIVVSLRLTRLPTIWADLNLPAGAALTLVDATEGRILAGTEGVSAEGETLEPLPAASLQAGGGAYFGVARDGVPKLFASAPIADTTWAMTAEYPTAAVIGPIYAAARERALPAVAISGTIFLALLVLWRRQARRLRALDLAAARWTQGEWAYRGASGARTSSANWGRPSTRWPIRLRGHGEPARTIGGPRAGGLPGRDGGVSGQKRVPGHHESRDLGRR